MNGARQDDRSREATQADRTGRAIVIIVTSITALAFLFGFGNCWSLGIRLGAAPWVAPLVGPAVDLSVIGLLLARWFLAEHGAPADELAPVKRLLAASCLATLALNVTEPAVAGRWGQAAFDAVAPLLLMAWSETGPRLLVAIHRVRLREHAVPFSPMPVAADADASSEIGKRPNPGSSGTQPNQHNLDDLVERAQRENARHWVKHHRPISADALRQRLRVGSKRARILARIVRDRDEAQRQTELGSATVRQPVGAAA